METEDNKIVTPLPAAAISSAQDSLQTTIPSLSPSSTPVAPSINSSIRGSTTPANKQKKESFRLHVSDIRSSLRCVKGCTSRGSSLTGNISNKFRRTKSNKIEQVRRFGVVQSMQTKSLDGEQNLKTAIVFEDTHSVPEDTSDLGATEAPPRDVPIINLCDVLKESDGTSLGYLKCGNYIYDLLAQSLSYSETSTTTLSELLEANAIHPYNFPAEKRALLAVILASSFLQLQKTHWISDTWSKRDIFFTLVSIISYSSQPPSVPDPVHN